jgi:hypothetical protein
MIPKPTRSEIAQAFEDGAEVKAGFPTCVRTDKATHVLDLVSAMRGDPDPWHSFTKNDDLIEMASANYRSLYWVDRKVEGGDIPLLDRIIAALPPTDLRHAPEGHDARLECGRMALGLRDAHLRAAVMTYVDGWVAIEDVSELLDESDEGRLYASPDEENIDARVLVVTCPSTGRIYGHLVPSTCATAAEGRRWMMGMDGDSASPEVET